MGNLDPRRADVASELSESERWRRVAYQVAIEESDVEKRRLLIRFLLEVDGLPIAEPLSRRSEAIKSLEGMAASLPAVEALLARLRRAK
jgi:hypothetical protein